MSAKRSDYISWDEYFYGVAHLSGMRSKDPNTQWEPVLSARTTKFCPWDTTGSPRVVPMMSFPGRGRMTRIVI